MAATSFLARAQKPQVILGIAKEVKSAEYYQEQIQLWKKETEKTPTNAHAWYNYYRASRAYEQKSEPEVWATDQTIILKRLESVVGEAKRAVGSSFEYYLMAYENTRSPKAIEYLKKAHSVAPERKEAYEGLLVHYVSTDQNDMAADIAKKMLACNYYSNANLMWNYNALQTTVQGALFITHGDMDAIPKWVLQYGAGIRPDVIVASKWLMAMEREYYELIFKKSGSSPFGKKPSDFAHTGEFVDVLTVHLLEHSQQAVYMGCGTSIKFFEQYELQDRMYLVGMAFRYSTQGFDNLGTTIKNFEKKYDLEYLLHNFQQHSEDRVVKMHMNPTYIPGLMKLKKHYEAAENTAKVKYYQSLIDRVADESGRRQEIMSWYE